MNAPTAPIFPVTVEVLQRWDAEYLAFCQARGDIVPDRFVRVLALAGRVIRNFAKFTRMRVKKLVSLMLTHPTFGLEGNTALQIALANALLAVQEVDGFLPRLRTADERIEALSNELMAAWAFKGTGVLKAFVIPSERGESYDFLLDVEGTAVACEAKGKSYRTKLSKSTILDSLYEADDQLPRRGFHGLICLTIPLAWQEQSAFVPTLRAALFEFERNRPRTMGVFIQTEENMPDDRGLSIMMQPIYVGPHPLPPVFDRCAKKLAETPWYTLRVEHVVPLPR